MCPNCKNLTTCGCESCQKNRGHLTTDLITKEGTDLVICPHCNKEYSLDFLEDYEFKLLKSLEKYIKYI